MRRIFHQGTILFIIGLLMSFAALRAKADSSVVVQVQFAGLYPDPVNIVAGMVVYWQDVDGGGYTVFIGNLVINTDAHQGVRFLAPGVYPYSDDNFDNGTVIVSANVPPSVTITNPAPNAVLNAPATFDFAADAADLDADGLSDVEFYVDGNLVDNVFASPFTTTVTNLPAGNHALTVIAYDNVLATTTNSITITVQNPGPIVLTPPAITAGGFRFSVTGLTDSKTIVLQSVTNLTSTNWVSLSTNIVSGTSASFTNAFNGARRFFRLLQLP